MLRGLEHIWWPHLANNSYQCWLCNAADMKLDSLYVALVYFAFGVHIIKNSPMKTLTATTNERQRKLHTHSENIAPVWCNILYCQTAVHLIVLSKLVGGSWLLQNVPSWACLVPIVNAWMKMNALYAFAYPSWSHLFIPDLAFHNMNIESLAFSSKLKSMRMYMAAIVISVKHDFNAQSDCWQCHIDTISRCLDTHTWVCCDCINWGFAADSQQ